MMRAGIKVKCRDRERLVFLCKAIWIIIHACIRQPSISVKVQRGGIAHRMDMAHRA